jgi:hypothetical protein
VSSGGLFRHTNRLGLRFCHFIEIQGLLFYPMNHPPFHVDCCYCYFANTVSTDFSVTVSFSNNVADSVNKRTILHSSSGLCNLLV